MAVGAPLRDAEAEGLDERVRALTTLLEIDALEDDDDPPHSLQ